MKKITFILTGIFLTAACLHAQPPALFNYQGTVRNSVGSALVNKTITLRLSVREGTAGLVLYSETRMVTTNAFGLFSVQIGSPGTISTTGSIPAVNWQNGNKYMQVEVDEKGQIERSMRKLESKDERKKIEYLLRKGYNLKDILEVIKERKK